MSNSTTAAATVVEIDSVAEQYVRLALALGQHDASYVDAYFGPMEWREEATRNPLLISDLRDGAEALLASVHSIDPALLSPIERQRHSMLVKRVSSMALRIAMAEGLRLPFDEESKVLFDAAAPQRDAEYFRAILAQIDSLIPGDGSLSQRAEAFRAQFVIPKDRLAAVFDAAIAECRRRTLQHIELPAGESFRLEFVTDQPWSGYNWYEGNYFSLIQINTDLPIYIARAVDLGCHEGYPGHHTYNVLLEQKLVKGRGWIEFTLGPLYGPQSLISEGSANYGIELAFPAAARLTFETDVLFPLAALDVAEAERYRRFSELLSELDEAVNEAARGYLDGSMTAAQTSEWLVSYALMSPERADQQISFIENYRSYVINYSLGQDLVRDFVTRNSDGDSAKQWTEFERLLSLPFTPSELTAPEPTTP